jgi:hypothetical protein
VCNSFELDYTVENGKLAINLEYFEVKKEQCFRPPTLATVGQPVL